MIPVEIIKDGIEAINALMPAIYKIVEAGEGEKLNSKGEDLMIRLRSFHDDYKKLYRFYMGTIQELEEILDNE